MKRRIITTADGSKTIQIEDWNEQYHSMHGAIQEAMHVFIKHGLQYFCSEALVIPSKNTIHILEIGFGTGLNTFLTLLESEEISINVKYTGVEGYPVSGEELLQLNYPDLIDPDQGAYFKAIHEVPWEEWSVIKSSFSLLKHQKLFHEINSSDEYDLIYFDAFGARVQPELWTESVFASMYKALRSNGVLVTYSAKGSVRRAMETVGFIVERLPGPPGKREMLRARKVL